MSEWRSRLGLAVMAAALVGLPVSASAAGAAVGRTAPAFTLVTFEGKTVKLSDLQGQVIVLNYWATWCGPCRNEMPMFDSYLRHHPDQGLRIFSITTEGSVSPDRLRPLARLLTFPLVTKFWGGGYGVIRNAVPTSYIIDRSGVVRVAQAGSFSLESFDAAIAPLLAEPAPAAVLAPTSTGR